MVGQRSPFSQDCCINEFEERNRGGRGSKMEKVDKIMENDKNEKK